MASLAGRSRVGLTPRHRAQIPRGLGWRPQDRLDPVRDVVMRYAGGIGAPWLAQYPPAYVQTFVLPLDRN